MASEILCAKKMNQIPRLLCHRKKCARGISPTIQIKNLTAKRHVILLLLITIFIKRSARVTM
jgi:hypothetical protein